jgi:hypothetical protein
VSTCLSLGTTNSSALLAFVAERWNGSAWSFVPIATPAAFVGARLDDVSCSGPSDCFAVGSTGSPTRTPLMERWNGTAWSIVTAPVPAGASDAWLTGVSCVSATFCLVTGDSAAGSAEPSPYGARWNGSTWTLVAVPSPANPVDVKVDAVSCVTTTACFAVGHKETSATTGRTLVERWNGTAWSIVSSPTPEGPDQIDVSDVSCTAATSCFAVGTYPLANGRSHPFSLRLNGTTWSVVAFPAPAGASGHVRDVSCVDSTNCFAAGTEDDYIAAGRTWIQRWNGTKWSTAAHPDPGDESSFDDITCTSSAACMTVGVYEPTWSSQLLSLTERWNGTAWAVSPPPAGGSQSQLGDVSCPTTTFCVAIGAATNTSVLPFSKRWDGTNWTIVTMPTPSGASYPGLGGVSCTSSTHCFAVGSYFAAGGITKMLIERWDGTAWSIVTSPAAPNGQSASLGAVSCQSATNCTAVGSGTSLRVMLLKWNGSVWAVTNGLSDTSKLLRAVSCPAATSCVAVGSNGSGAFARHWNGSTWTTVATPTPSGAHDAGLTDVSCTSPTQCTAIGSSSTNTTIDPLIERWNGTAWSIQTSPTAPAGSSVSLEAVSCASSTSCVAVGSRASSQIRATLVEQWNGATWTVVPSPNRVGTSFDILDGVSCATTTVCKAVGRALSDRYQFTLIAQYQ